MQKAGPQITESLVYTGHNNKPKKKKKKTTTTTQFNAIQNM